MPGLRRHQVRLRDDAALALSSAARATPPSVDQRAAHRLGVVGVRQLSAGSAPGPRARPWRSRVRDRPGRDRAAAPAFPARASAAGRRCAPRAPSLRFCWYRPLRLRSMRDRITRCVAGARISISCTSSGGLPPRCGEARSFSSSALTGRPLLYGSITRMPSSTGMRTRKWPGEGDAVERQAEPARQLDLHHRQRDRDAELAVEDLVQVAVARIVVLRVVAGEAQLFEQVAVDRGQRRRQVDVAVQLGLAARRRRTGWSRRRQPASRCGYSSRAISNAVSRRGSSSSPQAARLFQSGNT